MTTPSKRLAGMLGIGFCLMAGGCSTMQAYDGERRSRDELAHIVGDWRLRAGAPVSVILRRVDENDVGVRYSAIDVLPGKHRVLADCTIAATKHVSRHELNVDLDEGASYRLIADSAPGNRECGSVSLQRLD